MSVKSKNLVYFNNKFLFEIKLNNNYQILNYKNTFNLNSLIIQM